MKKILQNWRPFELAWLFGFTAIGIGLSVFWGESWLSLAAMVSGIWCVVLTAKKSVLNYPIGVLNIVLYAYIAYKNLLFGDAMLNAFYFFPMQFVGYALWAKHMDKDTKEIKAINIKWWQTLAIIGVTAAITLGYSEVLQALGSTRTLLDATSTVVSVVAMFLMIKRYASQWELWIIVDVVSTAMWIGKDWIMVIMWGAYLLNAIWGYYCWHHQK